MNAFAYSESRIQKRGTQVLGTIILPNGRVHLISNQNFRNFALKGKHPKIFLE